MGLKVRFRKLAFLACFFAITPAMAAPLQMASKLAPVTPKEEARYILRANGLKIGHFFLWWEESAGQYKLTFSLKTSGLVRMIKKQDRYAQTTGTLSRNGTVLSLTPRHFTSTSKTSRKTRSIVIDYNSLGTPTKASVNPPDNPKIRPPVSGGGRKSAYDPLTAIQALFALSPQEKTQEFTVFDGRRLTKILLKPAADNPFGCKPCHVYQVARTPLEGFDAEDMEDYRKGDPDLWVATEEATSRLPIAARARTAWGILTANRE